MSDIIVYFNVNFKLLTMLIDSAFVGVWTTSKTIYFILYEKNLFDEALQNRPTLFKKHRHVEI